PRTSWPISTISPTYSWPTCIGTGIVLRAHSSHFQMWMSVPQIAVFRMRIMTSLCPTSGVLTSVSVSPGARSSLASAFIMFVALPFSVNRAERLADFRERGDGGVDLFVRVQRAHLRSDARLALRHDRVREPDHVDSLGEERIRHPRGERGVAEHHRDDRVAARHEVEPVRGHLPTEPLAVRRNAPAEPAALVALQKLEDAQRCRRDARRETVGEQIWTRPLAQELDDFPSPRSIAARR